MSLLTAALLGACDSDSSSPPDKAPPTSVDPTDPGDRDDEPQPPGTPPATPQPPAPPDPGATQPLAAKANADVMSALAAGGVDVANLPPKLADIEDRNVLMAIMRAFTVALGTDCRGCHAPNGDKIDAKVPTPNRNIANKMYEEFTLGLKHLDGRTAFCDSCHQGKMKFLDRSDKGKLAAWMKINLVDQLKTSDGSQNGCKNCHGDPMTPKFLEGWAQNP